MKTILICSESGTVHADRLRDAVALVNSSQSYFFLQAAGAEIQLEPATGPIDATVSNSQLMAEFHLQKVICVVDRPFTDNFFSHDFRHCAIITTCDWEGEFAPPSLRAYLAYQIVQALLCFAGDLSEEMLVRMAHETPVGCLNDFSGYKPEIKYGMRAGSMCFQCEGQLRQFGVDPAAIDSIRRVLSVVRDEAIGRPRLVDALSAFVVMRFSKNDENDNAYQYGVAPGLLDVGLTVHRADDVVHSSQLLEKVHRYLERSRFIVVKTDVDNLNVYFELGLAMGLDKDVLLISESSLVQSLPSDLRNWECLTYGRGNYKELRSKVGAFYRANFRLGEG